jgi:hypothetical protein
MPRVVNQEIGLKQYRSKGCRKPEPQSGYVDQLEADSRY